MMNTITAKARAHRIDLARNARDLICHTLPVEDADGQSLMIAYGDFYLQVAFSGLHPLMIIYLARAMGRPCTREDVMLINELNLKGVLGCHALNKDAGCYSFRAVHWLDAELTQTRFLEMLGRDAGEARQAYALLAQRTGTSP
jgi:hypothetical protein